MQVKKIFKDSLEKTKNFLKKHSKIIKSIVLALFIAINVVSCIVSSLPREPTTAHAEDNGVYDSEFLENGYPPLYITTNIRLGQNISKVVSVNLSIDNEGEVYCYVGGNSYLLLEGEYRTIPLSISNYGNGQASIWNAPVTIIQTFSTEFWQEGVTSFDYDKQYSIDGGGILFTFNDYFELGFYIDVEWATTVSSTDVLITSVPTYTFMYTDTVYERVYNKGYNVGINNIDSVRPFKFIVKAVNDLFSIEIVEGVELGMLLWLGLGIILFNFVVKLLLGG